MTLIALDFDGVIHQYVTPWQDALTVSDPPMPGAFEFILTLLDKNYEVAIISSRNRTIHGQHAMATWMLLNGFPPHKLTEIQWPSYKPPAFLTIDDRAIQFSGSWPSLDFIKEFKPWKMERKKSEEKESL